MSELDSVKCLSSVTVIDNTIYLCVADGRRAEYDAEDGRHLRGDDLAMPPREVLFRVWAKDKKGTLQDLLDKWDNEMEQ